MAIRVFVACVVLLIAAPSVAQPNAWVARTVFAGIARIGLLQVFDLGVNTVLMSLRLPDGVEPGKGAITPDGRYFLLPTSAGIGRFVVATRQFEGMFGPAGPAGPLWISPSGRWVHVLAPGGRYRVLDGATGTLLREDCCTDDASTVVAFSTGSGLRVVGRRDPVGFRVTAHPEDPDTSALWSVTMPGATSIGSLHADDAFVTFVTSGMSGPEIVVLDSAQGTEVGRRSVMQLMDGIPIPAPFTPALTGLDRHGRTLVASFDSSVRHDLLVIEVPTLTRLANVERPGPIIVGRMNAREVRLTADGSTAYWTYWYSLLGVTVSYTNYDIVDISTRRVMPGGGLGSQFAGAMTLEATAPCVFDVPVWVDVPSTEGVTALTVRPTAACPPWTATGSEFVRVLESGPHVGTRTLHLALTANQQSPPAQRFLPVGVGGHSVGIRQAAETMVPAAPLATAVVTGNRVAIGWVPSVGPAPTAFTVRGGIRGQPMTPVISLSADMRAWTSPALPAGSYAVEVTASNAVGESAPSNRIDLSVGAGAIPLAPALTAIITDDTLRLSWLPAAAGPAPEAFVVEAATASGTDFTPVTRVGGQSLFVPVVPAGAWRARVRAVTAAGVGDPSNVVSFVAQRCAAAPASPTALGSVTEGALVALRWTSPDGAGPPAYIVEAGSAPGLSNYLRMVVSGADPFLQTVAPAGVFHVRIRAHNACGSSLPSNEIVVWVR